MTFKRKNPLITPEFVAQARQLTVTEAKEVTKLNLSGFQLRGKATVGGFPNLKSLNLAVNELTELKLKPDSVNYLEEIDLSSNHLNKS